MTNVPFERLSAPNLPYSLTGAQLDTARLLGRLLGRPVAERYVDFCNLCYGEIPLRVPSPLAAHSIRELNSVLLDALELLAVTKRPRTSAEALAIKSAKSALKAAYTPDAIEVALNKLGNKTYIEKIKQISSWLGLDPLSPVVASWMTFKDVHAKAHERRHNRSFAVGDSFRETWVRPFEVVVRTIAAALEGRYAAFTKRVDDLARMTDAPAALKQFDKEIPGAPPLQWHFYNSIEGVDWLPPIIALGLAAEPVTWLQEDGEFRAFGEWPVGQYLQKMAKHEDPATRALIIEAVQRLKTTTHTEVRRTGLAIIAQLPANEAVTLTDVVVTWLAKDSYLASLSSAETIVQRLAVAGHEASALIIARSLFQIFETDGRVDSLYSRHLYEHSVPIVAGVLTDHCGVEALRLFVELLHETAIIDKKIKLAPFTDHSELTLASLANEEPAYDITGALVQIVRRAASTLIQGEYARQTIECLNSQPFRMFKRLAMHFVSLRTDVAPEIADGLLFDPNNLEEHAFRHEYAELAVARFPELTPDRQNQLLAIVDATPAKYLDKYKEGIRERENREVTPEQVEAFADYVVLEVTFYWRRVLPPGRQAALEAVVEAQGEPDAWMNRSNDRALSPQSAADFGMSSISETVAFLRNWKRFTADDAAASTALEIELRNAANAEPMRFSRGARDFIGLPIHYIYRVIEGIRTPVQNGAHIDWLPVLALIGSFLSGSNGEIDHASVLTSKYFRWAARESGELLRAGLGRGKDGMPYDCSESLLQLLTIFEQLPYEDDERDSFEERYLEYPYFAAEQTMCGLTADLFILFLFWSTKQEASPHYSQPRDVIAAIPEFTAFAHRALRYQDSRGRIVRVIFGRYLTYLFFLGERWLGEQFSNIFSNVSGLEECAWLGHLLNDRPAKSLLHRLMHFYEAEVDRLSSAAGDEKREARANRITEYLMVLMLWGVAPIELIERFERRASRLSRRHALWFVGREMQNKASSLELRARGEDYWERRLSAAETAHCKDEYREELEVAGFWGAQTGPDSPWLMKQYIRMLSAGFSPANGFALLGWLSGACRTLPAQAVKVLDLYISQQKADRWATMGQEASVAEVLEAGKKLGDKCTQDHIDHVVGVLSSRGDSAFLRFARQF